MCAMCHYISGVLVTRAHVSWLGFTFGFYIKRYSTKPLTDWLIWHHTLKYVVSKNSQVFFFTDKLNQKCSTATEYIIYLFIFYCVWRGCRKAFHHLMNSWKSFVSIFELLILFVCFLMIIYINVLLLKEPWQKHQTTWTTHRHPQPVVELCCWTGRLTVVAQVVEQVVQWSRGQWFESYSC